jgi:hypothetical protein
MTPFKLPMEVSIFPGEFFQPARTRAGGEWPKLFYWNEASRGGHFAAWEQAEIFVAELRNAFRCFQEPVIGASLFGGTSLKPVLVTRSSVAQEI